MYAKLRVARIGIVGIGLALISLAGITPVQAEECHDDNPSLCAHVGVQTASPSGTFAEAKGHIKSNVWAEGTLTGTVTATAGTYPLADECTTAIAGGRCNLIDTYYGPPSAVCTEASVTAINALGQAVTASDSDC